MNKAEQTENRERLFWHTYLTPDGGPWGLNHLGLSPVPGIEAVRPPAKEATGKDNESHANDNGLWAGKQEAGFLLNPPSLDL